MRFTLIRDGRMSETSTTKQLYKGVMQEQRRSIGSTRRNVELRRSLTPQVWSEGSFDCCWTEEASVKWRADGA